MTSIQAQPSHLVITFAVIAVGGYGRGELCPESDVDLLILHNRGSDDFGKFLAHELVYLLWAPPGSGPADHARIAQALTPGLLALEPRAVWLQVDDADAQVPVPLPPPEGEHVPMGVVSIWLDRYDDRGPYEALLREQCDRIAGYLVLESMYTDYGGNRHSAPRDWPDGVR